MTGIYATYYAKPPLTVRSAWRRGGGGTEQSCERARRITKVGRYHACTFRIVEAAAAAANAATETSEVEVE